MLIRTLFYICFEHHTNMGAYRLQSVIDRLCVLEFIEPSGKTSGLSYILYVSKRKDLDDKIDYVKSKKARESKTKRGHLTLFGFHTYYQ